MKFPVTGCFECLRGGEEGLRNGRCQCLGEFLLRDGRPAPQTNSLYSKRLRKFLQKLTAGSPPELRGEALFMVLKLFKAMPIFAFERKNP